LILEYLNSAAYHRNQGDEIRCPLLSNLKIADPDITAYMVNG